MNPAMFLVASLVLCALPSALGLTCHHCMGDVANAKLCTSMDEYMNQTCMGADAHCATTELKSNVSEVKAYVLGCVDEPHNCSSYEMELCKNATMAAAAAVGSLGIELCDTHCCNSSDFCNAEFVPTPMAPETSTSTSGTGTTTEGATSAARVFRPELIGMLSIVLMAVIFGLQ